MLLVTWHRSCQVLPLVHWAQVKGSWNTRINVSWGWKMNLCWHIFLGGRLRDLISCQRWRNNVILTKLSGKIIGEHTHLKNENVTASLIPQLNLSRVGKCCLRKSKLLCSCIHSVSLWIACLIFMCILMYIPCYHIGMFIWWIYIYYINIIYIYNYCIF